MDNIEYIENYFKGNNDSSQKEQFEKRIMEDPSFAEDVAFYISANGILQQQVKDEKKKRFRGIYEEQKVVSIKRPVMNLWKYVAAAAVIVAVLLVTWFVSVNKNSPQQLADLYIQQNWQTLPVKLSDGRDSIQTGLNLFNSKKPDEALVMFEAIAQKDPGNINAKKYAGIVSLRLGNYDKALKYFTMLESDSGLYSNPGKFYKAITLLKRNKNDDKEEAKQLLNEVKDGGLEGKIQAIQWLKKLD